MLLVKVPVHSVLFLSQMSTCTVFRAGGKQHMKLAGRIQVNFCSSINMFRSWIELLTKGCCQRRFSVYVVLLLNLCAKWLLYKKNHYSLNLKSDIKTRCVSWRRTWCFSSKRREHGECVNPVLVQYNVGFIFAIEGFSGNIMVVLKPVISFYQKKVTLALLHLQLQACCEQQTFF